MTADGVIHTPVPTLRHERFRALIGEDGYAEVEVAVARAADLFAGRVIWHVNSTARGGGVVELLQSLLGYARGAGVDARWVVIDGAPEFFEVTKRIHNRLHGSSGDGGELGDAEREIYETTLRAGARELARSVRPQDVVFCHDPQTAGLVEPCEAIARFRAAKLRALVTHAAASVPYYRALFARAGVRADDIR